MTDDDTRSRILGAALDMLNRFGAAGLTVRAVASEAGCSTIGVYTHFGGKDGLIDAVLTDGFVSLERSLKRARPEHGPMGALRAQAVAYRRWALKHPQHYRVMFADPVDHRRSDEASAAGVRAYLMLNAAVAAAIADGGCRVDDVDAVTLACWGLVHGLVMLQLANPKPPKERDTKGLDERAFTLALDAFVRGFAP